MSATRLTWDEYFTKMLSVVSERATCDRGRAACVVTRDRQVLATGYVGSPAGFPHCDDAGHLIEDGHCVRTVHAEQNALASAARRGIALDGTTWYTTLVPCHVCAMLMVTAGAQRVVAAHTYQSTTGLHILHQANVSCKILSREQLYDPAR